MLRTPLIVLAVVLVCMSVARSDSERAPYGHVTASESGRFYFRMFPPGPDAPAHGTLFRVKPTGEDERLWSVEGWYAFRVFVARDGRSLVRLGNWPQGMAPSEKHLGVAFYRDGKLLREYSTKDLIKDTSKVRPSVSHYQYYDGEDPPGLVSLHVNGSYHHLFRLRSIDGITYLFDPTTGTIVNQSPSEQDIVTDEATALAVGRAVLRARFGPAPEGESGRVLKATRLLDEWLVDTPVGAKPGFHVRIQARDGCVIRLEQLP